MTLEILAANAGISVREVARHWPVYRTGLREKQLRHRIARIRYVIKHGGINIVSAERLGNLLNCDPGMFLFGQEFWKDEG